jgi:DNA-binding NarL/FixJ family response regulator
LSAFERAFPGTPIAVMSQRDDDAVIAHAIQCGVKCYLPTSLPLEIAVAALRLTLVGGVYYPRQIGHEEPPARGAIVIASPPNGSSEPAADRLSDSGGHALQSKAGSPAEGVGGLTRREVEVLAALQRGRSNKLIACELGMSENTVKVHIQRIMRKLRASNRTEAVLISQRRLAQLALASDARP